MTWTKWVIIIGSFAFLAYFAVALHFRFEELREVFFYLDDWFSWIMVFLLILALKGILEWFFKWELRTLK